MQSNTQAVTAADYFNRVSKSNPVFINRDTIAYLDDSSGTNQLFLVDLSTGDNRRITDFSEGILTLIASPSTGTIVYGIDQNGNERQQLYAIANNESSAVRITHDDNAFFEPGALTPDGELAVYRTNSRDESIFDVEVCNLTKSKSRIWLQDGGQVLPQDISQSGALIIQSRDNASDDLLLITEARNTRNFTEDVAGHRIYCAVFDADNEKAWVVSEIEREFPAVFLLDLVSGEFSLFYEADWGVELVSISPDGNHLALSVNENGYSVPYILPTTNAANIREMKAPEGVIDRFSWSPDSSQIVFGLSNSENPSQLFISDLRGNVQPVMKPEEKVVPTVPAESVHFRTWDDRAIPAYLYLPDGPGPHAALIEIHGGPESQRRPEYGSTGASIQFLVSQGIAVLALNIRGSIGYGREYRHLDDKDKRLDALKDVEQAVKWLGSRDDISADRIAVFGISYGGFMTLSALTRLPQLWAAGAEMVGMAHLETFLERTGPWRRPHREGEYGTLANDREMLRAVSPLPLVDQISAPLLVLHGKNDARVPLFESEQIVEAVSSRGLDVGLVIYDDEGHIFTKRKNLVDAYTRIGDFLRKHLRI